MPNLHYKCTQCGVCCRNIKIPLTAAEASVWLSDGHQVQLICEALPSMPAGDRKAAHLIRRSFAAVSGTLATRIIAMLVANIVGDCPNLLPDMRCGIYARRPLVCRIYPAEINPVVQLEPQNKACPPEAWAPVHPLLQRDGRVVNDAIRDDVARWRNTDASDVEVKRRLCAALNIADAAVHEEGFLVYSRPLAELSRALSFAMDGADASIQNQWRFVSDRSATIEGLAQSGASACHSRDLAHMPYQYIGLQRPSPIPAE